MMSKRPGPSSYHQKSSNIIYKDLESGESEYEEEVNTYSKPTARKVRKKERERIFEWNNDDPHLWVECNTCGRNTI